MPPPFNLAVKKLSISYNPVSTRHKPLPICLALDISRLQKVESEDRQICGGVICGSRFETTHSASKGAYPTKPLKFPCNLFRNIAALSLSSCRNRFSKVHVTSSEINSYIPVSNHCERHNLILLSATHTGNKNVARHVQGCDVYPGGALGYFLGGYVPPETSNWHPVLKQNSPKIDTPF